MSLVFSFLFTGLHVLATPVAPSVISQHHDVVLLNTSFGSTDLPPSLAAPPPPPPAGQWNVWLGAAIYQYEDEKRGDLYPVFPFLWIDTPQPLRVDVAADSDGRRFPRVMLLPKELHGFHPSNTEYRDAAGEVIQQIWFIGTTRIANARQMISIFAQVWEEHPFYHAGPPRGYTRQWKPHIEFNFVNQLYQRILVHPWLPVTSEWQMWQHLMSYATRYFSHVISVWLRKIDKLELEVLTSKGKNSIFLGYIIERGGNPRPLWQTSMEGYGRNDFLAEAGFTRRDSLPAGFGFISGHEFILPRRKVNQTFRGRVPT